MTGVAVSSILLGLIIIAARGPMIFWPGGTRSFYMKLFDSNTRIRIMGLVTGALGTAMIMAARGVDGALAQLILAFGCLIAFAALFLLLIFTSIYKIIALAVLEGSDDLILKGAGVFSLAMGSLFIYLGAIVL